MQKVSIVILILAVLSFIGYISYDQLITKRELPQNIIQKPTLEPTIYPSPNATILPTDIPSKNEGGTIEGSISFPSETIPADLVVCAETLQGVQVKCTNEHIENIKYTYRVGYKMELPTGKYYVYSQVPSMQTGYKAYYNEFVTCGLSVNCTSHKNIIVEVMEGETLTGIDPQDWYNQPSP